MTWQPIKTAPKSGEGEFLVRDRRRNNRVVQVYRHHDNDDTVVDQWLGIWFVAYEWMPIPEPPK